MKLFACCLLFFTFCSLLGTSYWLLVIFCLSLFSLCLLLVAFFLLLFTFCFACYFFLCFLLFACWWLLSARCAAPLTFPREKKNFSRKIGKYKFFTCEYVNNFWEFSLFIKWQKVDSFFWICCFNSKLSYHSYQQRVCKFLFSIGTLVKTNSNLMHGFL